MYKKKRNKTNKCTNTCLNPAKKRISDKAKVLNSELRERERDFNGPG